MNRQMMLAEMKDELGAARTNKKEFLEKLERIIPWTEFIKLIKLVLLQSRARQQTISVGTDAENFHTSKCVYPFRYGSNE